jgi:hypothetical protein
MSANDQVASSGNLQPLLGATLVFQTVLEYFVYIIAIVIVTMIVTLWLAGSRATLRQSDGRGNKSSRRRSPRRWFGRSEDKDSSGGKRRRRRSQRRRNPTLAETGGLPPIRNESSSADSYQN